MWEQIQANKRKAFWLITLMALILLLLGYSAAEAMEQGAGPLGLLIGAVIFFVQLGVYTLAGETVLMAGMGAREMTREESPRLFNIVEEMQLASGLGFTPRIYIIDTDAPNAFAVGRKPETSIVAVTRGLMYRLNRDELQGVIAHEIGHLKNQDTKFMTLAGVMLGSIIIMSDVAARMFFYGGRGRRRSDSRGSSNSNSGGGQAQAIMFIVAIILIVLGPILARLLYFALSRTREYLADASAAVYTRYPEGLASALIKISGDAGSAGDSIGQANRAVAPMFIVNPLAANSNSDSVFSTHPPVQDRIRILRAMGGASFLDYDAAFRLVRKGGHVVGEHTRQESQPQAIRAAFTDEAADAPLETRAEGKAVVHAMMGYATIKCPCGATLKVPSTYDEDTVRCIRCGRVHPRPDFVQTPEQARREAMLGGMIPGLNGVMGAGVAGAAAGPPPVYEYTRKSPGIWEGFPCVCGQMIQLSPALSAPQIQCRNCGALWKIH